MRRTGFAGAATLASLGILLCVAGVSVAVATPAGEYAPFADCPVRVENVNSCLVGEIEDGTVVIGRETLPIVKSIRLQLGFTENGITGALTSVAAADGDTL